MASSSAELRLMLRRSVSDSNSGCYTERFRLSTFISPKTDSTFIYSSPNLRSTTEAERREPNTSKRPFGQTAVVNEEGCLDSVRMEQM